MILRLAFVRQLAWPASALLALFKVFFTLVLLQQIFASLRQGKLLAEMITDFCVGGTGREMGYLRSLLELFAALSEQGHCVIVGRGAPYVLPAESTLRVRMVAPRKDRIDSVEKTQGLSKAEAERWIDRTDAERRNCARA